MRKITNVLKYFLMLSVNLAFWSGRVYAQVDTAFWFAAPDISASLGQSPVFLRLLTYDEPAIVTISQPANGSFLPIVLNIPANSVDSVNLSAYLASIEGPAANVVANNGLKIAATSPVGVIYELRASTNKETIALKGRYGTGTNFYTPFQQFWDNGITTPASFSSFDIVAAENNTTVLVTPRTAIVGHAANSTFSVVLNAGQTYSARDVNVSAATSLSGSIVSANKPVAVTVFNGAMSNNGCLSTMMDQITSTQLAGTTFIVRRGSATGERLYILGTQNNTGISITGSSGITGSTVSSSETYEYAITDSVTYIQASKPVYLWHATGYGCRLSGAQVPAVSCAGSTTVSFTRTSGDSLILHLYTRDGNEGLFTLNGNSGLIPSSAFSPVPGTNGAYKSASIALSAAQVPVHSYNTIENTGDVFGMAMLSGTSTTGSAYSFASAFRQQPTADAGPDAEICANDSLELGGRVGNGAIEGVWSTNGAGSFLNGNSSLANTYIPAATDAQPGAVYLVLTTVTNCNEQSDTLFLTVKPVPQGEVTPTLQEICSGNVIEAIVPENALPGVALNWIRDNTMDVTGITASGSGNISGTLTNTTNAPVTVTFTITPSGNGCTGTPQGATVVVQPTPAVNIIPDQTVCNGTTFADVNFSGPVAGTVFSWTNDNPDIGLPVSGTGNIAGFTATNNTNAPITATVTVTPSTGVQTFSNTGSIAIPESNEFGIGSANPYPSTINVSGLDGNLTHVAVKLNGLSHSYPVDLDMLLVGPGGQNVMIMSDAGNNYNMVGANLVLDDNATALLPKFSQIVSGTYKPTNHNGYSDFFKPPAPAPSANTLLSAFNGTGPNGTWSLYIMDNVLEYSGSLSGGWELVLTTDPVCSGAPQTFTYTINPTPTVVAVDNQVVCHGAPTTEVTFDGAVSGTVYNWTNDNPSIGLAATGTGTIPSFNAINTGNAPVTATVTVTPSYTHDGVTCTGTPQTFTITVNDTFVTNLEQTVYDYELPVSFGGGSLNTAGTFTHVYTAQSGCDSTVHFTLNVIYTYDIAGKVHNDVNGMNGSPSAINGTGTNAGSLKAVLVDAVADTVVAYTSVAANGDFSFIHILENSYHILVTTENIVGNSVPAITLPNGWVHTGEKLGAGNGSDGMADGLLNMGTVNTDISVRFGIQQPPLATNSSIAAQLNPGSNVSVNLPNSSFVMNDPTPGAVTQVRFTAFPAGADVFLINGNSYNSGNWPGVVTVNAQYLFGNLIMPNITIDPATGPQQVMIRYQALDAAGTASDTATITMPFSGIEIGGIVHNNFQGMNGSPLNTINGPGTNGGGLYAILSDDISNIVIAAQAVNGSTGAYQFTGIDKGYYSVRLSTATAAPGSPAPAPSINPGWKATAEKNGTGSGNDGYADSKIYIGLQSANNNNVRFGIQQPPTASPATAASLLNPNGNINYTVPATTFVTLDAAPGAVTSLYFSGALPANANKLVLNGVTYSATNPLPSAGVHVAFSGGSPASPILVDPVNGNVTVAISYNAVDAAGMMSATTIAAQPFHKTAALAGSNNSNGNTSINQEEQGFSAFRIMDIQVYPNPAKDRVFIKANDYSPVKALRLLDINGRELRITRDNPQQGMDMSGLEAGSYLLQVDMRDGSGKRFKVVKE